MNRVLSKPKSIFESNTRRPIITMDLMNSLNKKILFDLLRNYIKESVVKLKVFYVHLSKYFTVTVEAIKFLFKYGKLFHFYRGAVTEKFRLNCHFKSLQQP